MIKATIDPLYGDEEGGATGAYVDQDRMAAEYLAEKLRDDHKELLTELKQTERNDDLQKI